MSADEHIRAAVEHLESAIAILRAGLVDDGFGSKPKALRFSENALVALSQAGVKC